MTSSEPHVRLILGWTSHDFHPWALRDPQVSVSVPETPTPPTIVPQRPPRGLDDSSLASFPAQTLALTPSPAPTSVHQPPGSPAMPTQTPGLCWPQPYGLPASAARGNKT